MRDAEPVEIGEQVVRRGGHGLGECGGGGMDAKRPRASVANPAAIWHSMPEAVQSALHKDAGVAQG
jgi:hypothetical protein